MDSTIPTSSKSVILLRVMSSFIFIIAGLGHLFNPAMMLEKLAKSPIGSLFQQYEMVHCVVNVLGIPLVLLGISFMLGYKVLWSAFGLLMLLIGITITAQIGSPELIGPLFKNVAISGVLIFFIMNDSE